MGTQSADIARGKEAMIYFHNQALHYPDYKFNFEQLLDAVGGGGPKNPIFLEGFGFAIEQVDLDHDDLKSSMENLADAGRGQIPGNQSGFFKALSDQAQNINWVKAAPSIAKNVAVDVVKGVAAGGESVIQTLQSLNVIMPLLIVGGVVFVFISKVKKAAA